MIKNKPYYFHSTTYIISAFLLTSIYNPMKTVIILGRQPELGLAELESLYGADNILPIGHQAALVDIDPCVFNFDRLGGAVKFCKLLTELESNNWTAIEQFLITSAPEQSTKMPAGKMTLGLSVYGFSMQPRQVQRSGLAIKQAIKATGRNVRVAPNNDLALSSAQVIHNKLTSSNGWELVIIKNGPKTIIAQTIKVQNISAYAKRDQARPARDARVGMLPPKLAQIIINLAVGQLPNDTLVNVCEAPDQNDAHVALKGTLLDPFCGSGVIIQEAMIMGYNCIGSDISNRMVDYTRQNIDWLSAQTNTPIKQQVNLNLTVADATKFDWPQKPDYVASEIYLGKPLQNLPNQTLLNPIIEESNRILGEFLTNIFRQLVPNGRLCLAVPCWRQTNGQFIHLPVIDSLGVIGYNRVSFQHYGVSDLIYYRSDQVVARELLVLTRK